ncbi:MAG: hypothetical protein AAB834_02580 [Patescibacteria group bacterium]
MRISELHFEGTLLEGVGLDPEVATARIPTDADAAFALYREQPHLGMQTIVGSREMHTTSVVGLFHNPGQENPLLADMDKPGVLVEAQQTGENLFMVGMHYLPTLRNVGVRCTDLCTHGLFAGKRLGGRRHKG